MTDSSRDTTQAQTSQTSPWAASMPLINNLMSSYGSADTSVTGGQSAALGNLTQATSSLPNFAPQATGAVNNLFSSNNSPQVGMLQSAYDTMKTNLTPTASGANLDPYSTPGFGDAIRTMIDDTTNKTKGVYAGSGRDPSGAGSFAQSLGRGITQGVAPTIAGQYNTNFGNMVNANNSIFSGAGTTASGINNLRQTDLTNGVAGITAGGAIPGLATSPAMAQLAAANAQYQQPFSNLAALLQPSVALAGLGSNSSGSGTSNQTSTPSLMDSIRQGMQMGGTAMSGAGTFASMLPLLAMSDERLKENKTRVGELHDGTPVWTYNYIGDSEPRMGVMAQEVERRDPAAVVDVGGFKAVDYGRVTRRAARVGALAEAA